jgi:predicted nucleic acid-binding protein
MKKLKIYLETTLFNLYVDKNRGNDHINTVKLFEEIAAGKYEAFTSTYVTDELERAEGDKHNRMMRSIAEHRITILPASSEVAKMADIYVEEGVIPQRFRTDGLHVAIATVYGLDAIVSMNLRHIVKWKTILMTTYINESNGYNAVGICSPQEVAGRGKEDQIHRG